MKKLKQYFIEVRKATPKYVQWLLLIAAFVVVIILLTLVLQEYYNSKPEEQKIDEVKNVVWTIDPERLDFEAKVDDKIQKTIEVNMTDFVFIDDVSVDNDAEKQLIMITDCNRMTEYCKINVEYAPKAPQTKTETALTITYHMPNQETVQQTKSVPVTFSATKQPEKIEPKEEPKEEKKEDKQPEIITPVEDDKVEEIAPPVKFTDIKPSPKPQKTIDDILLPPENCSDFAIPGYDLAGVQIGWIKPDKGANYFHPFSDTDCSKPTGKYDWSTGIISSLSDGSKIGTDADHIGYKATEMSGFTLPKLSSPEKTSVSGVGGKFQSPVWSKGKMGIEKLTQETAPDYTGSALGAESVQASHPYDRTFILRQFKPIPATIVSEVRADPSIYGCSTKNSGGTCNPDANHSIPVRATVDRNVFSDDGRTIIVPTGTLLMGYLEGDLPGPYQSFGRMNIKWYQFIRPDGVEFNFEDGQDPYSGDAQGRVGVPGRGSTDYVEQMVMPILTAIVPAAVNMIAPIADTFVNQINLDTNTVVQSGTVRSSELAKQELINQWNRITNKLVVDAINNTVPPFSIPAGTRINVYSPVDLIVSCGDDKTKKCGFKPYPTNSNRRPWEKLKKKVTQVDLNDPSWVGQVRSWDLTKYCDRDKDGKWTIGTQTSWIDSGYDYRTVLMYCESLNYVAKNTVKNALYNEQVKTTATEKYGTMDYDVKSGKVTQGGNDAQKKAYNEEVLGLQYAEDGKTLLNPFVKPASASNAPADEVITCDDGSAPDANGCCAGETYTDMGEQGFNCCPDSGGDCFPPIIIE